MYQKELFKELMYQFVSGDISLEGKNQLLEMIDDAQYADDLDLFLREVYDGLEPSLASEQSTERFVKDLRGKMKTLVEAEEEITESSFFNWKKLAIAASVVLVVGLGYLKLNHDQPAGAIVSNQKVKNVIKPGSTGAILTLGDGSQIVLDSLANGVLANQNNTTVSKKDGKLVYKEGAGAVAVNNKMSTPRGRHYTLELSDGTKVWLNASSSISFPTSFAEKERKVAIEGEVYFEVAKDKNRPFRVAVKDIEVQVLGTHFNVNAYEDDGEIKTTLIEGSVLVGEKNKKVLLKPGQQAEIKNKGGVKVKNLENFNEVLAWKNGLFHFENASLETVLRQLSRWYDVDVVFEKGVTSRDFEGEIKRDLQLSQVLKILEGNKVHFKIEGKVLTVMP